ncbi:MAG TPA: glycosyltransferase [Rhodospirillales bacterium]|nr:glycosyltransferase [Rhodospirillales bacterium]
MTPQKKKRIGVVVPAYNEALNIEKFVEETGKVLDSLDGLDWHIRFVDDGSADSTWKIINELTLKNPKITGVRLSRNFGKEVALTAGAESLSNVDAVIFMDADLQHPPEIIPELVAKWKEGFQVVSTKRESIDYGLARTIGAKLFYGFLSRYSNTDITPFGTDFRLLDAKVLEVLCTLKERTRFFRGLIDWIGFERCNVTFSAPSRSDGVSTFKFKDLFNLAINSMTSFSLLPLRITGYLGILIVIFSSLVMIYMVGADVLDMNVFTPLAYFMVLNSFLIGVVLVGLGLIALYIGHIHTEVVQRPLYVIRETVGMGDDDD